MPRHNRILVRYRLPESNDQWSELQWCDIEKNAEDGSIQVRVAPARGAVMPEDRAFTVLPPEDAKKLLVWDVSSDENARAYCLVIQANALYRFDFDSRTDLLIAGKYWSLEKNDFDKDQPSLPIMTTFKDESIADTRLAMRTRDSYNYKQLTEKAEELSALKSQHTAWLQKLIQDRHREEVAAAAIRLEQEQQKQLEVERQRERDRREREVAELARERSPDPARRDVLQPGPNLEQDVEFAVLLQMDELAHALVGDGHEYDEDYAGHLDNDEEIARQIQLNELLQAGIAASAQQRQNDDRRAGLAAGQNIPMHSGVDSLDDEALARQIENDEARSARLDIPFHPRVQGRSPEFFLGRQSPNGANPPSRLRRPELKHVILALMGAALIGYGLYMLAYTSPWIGMGVIALAALCVCAAVVGRLPPPGAAERAQPPAFFGYLMGNR
ncbi:MAG: hypothetical protein NTU48_06650 [Legionellales bacterium]|nr:hypothetical protein [Legionellales bacterium]